MPGPHVNGLFQIRKWSKVHNNDQTVLIFWVKDEQTCLHICAGKRICDRLRTFDIIDQMACRSSGEQDTKFFVYLQVRHINPWRQTQPYTDLTWLGDTTHTELHAFD
jgi:hypothetical protein